MGQQITVVGDGAMATVCALLLDGRGAEVTMWGPLRDHVEALIQTRRNERYLADHPIPESIRISADDGCPAKAELIVSAIPSQYLRQAWGRIAEATPPGVPIVSVSKGVERETLMRPTQIIADVLEARGGADATDRPFAAISGPSVAHELARCLPATVAVASNDEQTAEQMQQLFTTEWFRVYTIPDLLGLELAGATKNVIALAAGIIDGLAAGINAKSALLSRGLAEITRLGVAMGARAETFFGVAGVGDLATTCFSETGRNRSCGELLGKGRTLDEALEEIPGVVEGVPTTRAVVDLARRHDVEMPITDAIYRVLFEQLDPIEGIGQLMTRQLKPERVR